MSSYAVRPPWNAAGIDYHTGYPTGTSLLDPSTISMTGVTVNAGTHTVTVSGNSVTLNGYDFGLANGWTVVVNGANDTVQNSHFKVGANQGALGTVLNVSGSASNFSLLANEVDGNNIPVTSQAGFTLGFAGTGSLTIQYNFLHNSGGDMVEVQGGTWTNQQIRYNLIQDIGYQTPHSDTIQWCRSAMTAGNVDFNTVYQSAAGLSGEGLIVLNSECPGANIQNMTVRDNTLISKVKDNFGVGQTITQDAGAAAGDHNATYNNYLDPTGINNFTQSPWFPTGQQNAALGTPGTVHTLTNMVTGTLITVPPQSAKVGGIYYVYPDNTAYSPCQCDVFAVTPSPATGNVTTGGTVNLMLTMDAPTTVTGVPTIALNSGGTALYIGGSGTKTLTFAYTVGSGDFASTLAITSIAGTMSDDVGNPTVVSPLTNLATSFAGLSVNAGNSLALISVPTTGTASSSVAFTFSYGGSAPGGMTCVWSPGSVAGGGVTGFSASGGTGSGSCPTPSVAATYTMVTTGTSPNTSTATAPNATVIGSPPPTSITFSVLANARTGFVTSGNGTYTGSAPTGLAAVYGGGCSGSSTATLSTNAGVWNAMFTTPTLACTGTMTITGTGPNTGTATSPSTAFVLGGTQSVQTGPYPGQAGDPVGYPAICAALTSFSGPWVANTTYHCIRYDAGTASVNINASGVTINGGYLGASTSGNQSQVAVSSSGAVQPLLNYVTVGPSPSVAGGSFPPQPPGGGGYTSWPSGTATVSATLGNCYGVLSNGSSTPAGGYTIQNSDIWALGNGINFSHTNGSNPISYLNNWVHDPMLTGAQCTHTDGIGDVASTGGDTVVDLVMDHNTVAGATNSNDLAMQFHAGNNAIYNHDSYTNNFFAGSGYTIDLGFEGASPQPVSIQFTGNVIGPTPTPVFGQNYTNWTSDFSISGSSNLWRLNTFSGGNYLCTGSCGTPIGNVPAGYYWYPDGSAHSTDFTGPD